MRLPKLSALRIPGLKPGGAPQFLDNVLLANPKVRDRKVGDEQTINTPLWPDDDYKAHPMSPQPQRVSPIAVRVLATLSGISEFGPRRVKVTRNGALTVAPERGSRLVSQEGDLDALAGAEFDINEPPATSIYIANDDPSNAITFQIAAKMNGNRTAPDFTGAHTQTLPAGSQPVGIDVTAYGIKLPATGNTSAYRLWAIV